MKLNLLPNTTMSLRAWLKMLVIKTGKHWLLHTNQHVSGCTDVIGRVIPTKRHQGWSVITDYINTEFKDVNWTKCQNRTSQRGPQDLDGGNLTLVHEPWKSVNPTTESLQKNRIPSLTIPLLRQTFSNQFLICKKQISQDVSNRLGMVDNYLNCPLHLFSPGFALYSRHT